MITNTPPDLPPDLPPLPWMGYQSPNVAPAPTMTTGPNSTQSMVSELTLHYSPSGSLILPPVPDGVKRMFRVKRHYGGARWHTLIGVGYVNLVRDTYTTYIKRVTALCGYTYSSNQFWVHENLIWRDEVKTANIRCERCDSLLTS